MSLHKPYFFIKQSSENTTLVCYNCDGALNFMATEHIDEKTERLLNMAFEEGERRMAQKMCDLLGVTKC